MDNSRGYLIRRIVGLLGISGVVTSLGIWRGVLAFGLGVVLGLSLDGVPEPAPVDPAVADEPVAAERRYATEDPAATRRMSAGTRE